MDHPGYFFERQMSSWDNLRRWYMSEENFQKDVKEAVYHHPKATISLTDVLLRISYVIYATHIHISFIWKWYVLLWVVNDVVESTWVEFESLKMKSESIHSKCMKFNDRKIKLFLQKELLLLIIQITCFLNANFFRLSSSITRTYNNKFSNF